MAHNQQNAQWELITLNKTRSCGTFKVNVNERTSVINSSPEYVHPLKEVVRLHMTEAIKAGWLTGSSDLWRQQTHKRLFLSASVFGRKGEQKQLVTEEIKWAAHNACLFLLFCSSRQWEVDGEALSFWGLLKEFCPAFSEVWMLCYAGLEMNVSLLHSYNSVI